MIMLSWSRVINIFRKKVSKKNAQIFILNNCILYIYIFFLIMHFSFCIIIFLFASNIKLLLQDYLSNATSVLNNTS